MGGSKIVQIIAVSIVLAAFCIIKEMNLCSIYAKKQGVGERC